MRDNNFMFTANLWSGTCKSWAWEGNAAGVADVDDHELEEHASLGFKRLLQGSYFTSQLDAEPRKVMPKGQSTQSRLKQDGTALRYPSCQHETGSSWPRLLNGRGEAASSAVAGSLSETDAWPTVPQTSPLNPEPIQPEPKTHLNP